MANDLHARLRCRVEVLGGGWDALHVEGAAIDEAGLFMIEDSRVGTDGTVEVVVVRSDGVEAIIEMPGMNLLRYGQRCRVPAASLALVA